MLPHKSMQASTCERVRRCLQPNLSGQSMSCEELLCMSRFPNGVLLHERSRVQGLGFASQQVLFNKPQTYPRVPTSDAEKGDNLRATRTCVFQ